MHFMEKEGEREMNLRKGTLIIRGEGLMNELERKLGSTRNSLHHENDTHLKLNTNPLLATSNIHVTLLKLVAARPG